ncbi:OsmC family protein [Vicingus serpentipes]|jgi:putative redox protein|uniref:OsmC family protein n=1 Tax=Vicingus serpentipes TaxID=1926625 RepID=A0A5C6RVT2_9FLAO|nr:OsmC family protein [Vicingus serpentipes]TXB65462.1 OsmC family protein [Vicingus serpentipes]
MITSKITYLGSLRTEATHLKSGKTILTDAPTDNHGKGEAFSPTDLVATALASCMVSILGIVANTSNINLGNIEAEITKIMSANPRKISEIIIDISFTNQTYTDKEKKVLENAARTCPVALSLNPEIKQTISFNFK